MPRPARPIFTQKWQDGLARSAETAMPADVDMFRKDPERVYNPETNSYTDVSTILYTGKARVQPLRSSRFEAAPMDSSYWQTVLISIPISEGKNIDFRVGDQARVNEAPLNPTVLKYQYTVNEIIDSANPFERTVLCSVKLDVTTG